MVLYVYLVRVHVNAKGQLPTELSPFGGVFILNIEKRESDEASLRGCEQLDKKVAEKNASQEAYRWTDDNMID